jgi:hypothetical protein
MGAPVVEPRFEVDTPARAPFPSDRFTVADRAQRTGLRMALPAPSCAVERSACDDARLVDELDGFDLDPRLALPFTGPIDPGSVSVRSVFLVRLAPGPPEAIGVERLVYDPAAHTLYARPDALLEPETRYGLVVTRELRDAGGRAIARSGAFARFLGGRDGAPAVRTYRDALTRLMRALDRRGVRADTVAAASVFTTGSVSGFLEQARDALERRPPPPALVTAPDGGGRAWFPRAALTRLVLHQQIRTATGGPDAVREVRLPVAALSPAVGGVALGWYWSPSYLTAERRIAEPPTARPSGEPAQQVPIAFVLVVPAGRPPAGGWPVALMGHGYGGEMLGSALLIADSLARHGVATAAITVVGHGGGPESRLVVERADGPPVEVRVPGRGVDLDGDGRIGAAEGLGATGAVAALGLRDGLRQQVVDLMALVRALRGGLDVDGDGVVDTRGDRMTYVGQSLGGIYGTLLLAVDPRVSAGVLNVPGGPVGEIARLSPVFRPLLRDTLARRAPPLASSAGGFHDDLPLRGDRPVLGPPPSALAIQDFLARAVWLARRGDPVAYARYLRAAPLPGLEPKRVLVQFAWGDGVVPNPTTTALIRAGQLADTTALLRYDRVVAQLPRELTEGHSFLLRVAAPGVAGALARAGQEQVARFLASDGAEVWNPDRADPPPFTAPVFEVPAERLPDQLNFTRLD